MEQLRKILATIQKNLGGMTTTHKLLIGSLAVIMLMALFLVSQYTGRSTMVAVWPAAPAEDQARAMTHLKAAGFSPVSKDGQTVVPTEKRQEAFAALELAGVQPTNSAVVFENILKMQNWINSKEQNRQIYKVMVNNELSGLVGKLAGIKSAKVQVDSPDQIGIGQPAKAAKASVVLFADPGKVIDAATVDAAAKLVAGSVAGLELSRVSVIDGSTGKARVVRSDDDLAPSTNRESARAIEREFEQKLRNLVSDIEGVVVAVTATVDVSRTKAQVTKTLPIGEGSVSTPKKEMTSSTTESQATPGAEPGVRSNVQADINSGGGKGARTEQKQEDTEYSTSFGSEVKQIEDPGGKPTRLVATVRVPRGFVVGLIQQDTPAAAAGGAPAVPAAAPSTADIETRFALEEARIRKSLLPHMQTRGPDGAQFEGEVIVTMMSGDVLAAAGGGGGAAAGFGGTRGTIWATGGGMIDRVVLGALALVAMGMMVLMVRKAGRKVEIASAEELSGLPPTLEAKSDLVGEADESETAMAGIEVGEEEIKTTKMRESVSELIKESPEVAGKLLNRWITVER